MRLLDDRDYEVAPGEVGEFCVRPLEPYAIFNGYFHAPELTVSAWRNLWYHTGDLGRRDADGEYFFVDRKADFIRYKGRNIASLEVEAAFVAHPAVAQAAAHGDHLGGAGGRGGAEGLRGAKPGQTATPRSSRAS